MASKYDADVTLSDGMQAVSLLSMDKLECHFIWQPDQCSTKSDSLDDVIRKTKEKMEREPQMKVAFLTTLAYLHTRTRAKVKFDEASDCLKKALEIDEQIRKDGLQDRTISSEFVIRADMLHLRQLMKGKKKPLTQQEIKSDMEILEKLWANKDNKARVFGVKGATYNCFGPMKYEEGAEAFKAASVLQPDKFLWLYGEARLRARCDRQTWQTPADAQQLALWAKARALGEAGNLTDAAFYSGYAEAVLHNKGLATLCQELADESVARLAQMEMSQKGQNHISYIVCLKVYRHLHRMGNIGKRGALMRDAKEVARCNRDPGFCLELSKMAATPEEKVKLLQDGQKLAGEPGHIWIELSLVEIQCRAIGVEGTVARYDSLRETFSGYEKNSAAVEFYKALYLLKCGRVKDALESCVSAVELNPTLDQVADFKKREFFRQLCNMTSGSEAFLAWFADNVGCFGKPVDVEAMYKAALGRDSTDAFVLEHLGRFHLKQRRYDLAEEIFVQLPADHENRKILLAESLLKNPNSDVKKLAQCLDYGCKDAALNILDLLLKRKSSDNVAQRVMNEVLSQPEETQHPLFFRRAVYDLCAKMDAVLRSSESFFVDRQLEASKEDFAQIVTPKIGELLELGSLMSRDSLQQPGGDHSAERGNLMRSSRLEMTRLHQTSLDDPQSSKRELSNQIVSVLKESKEVLDRSIAVRIHSLEFYVHAFNQMKSSFSGNIKKQLNSAASGPEKKKLEMESLIQLLREKPELRTLDSVRKHLQDGMKKVDKTFHLNRDLFDFMVNREYRILSNEDCWVIRWIYPVNSEKHANEILVSDLNNQLRSDWSGSGACERTAYDVAHLAAEFAEETWAVLSAAGAAQTP